MRLKDKRMTNEFEISALWNLNDSIEETTFGVLTFSQDRVVLILPNIDMEIDEKVESAFGITQTKTISLFNLQVIGNYDNNLRHTKLIAEYMIIDSEPIEKLEEFKLNSVTLSFDYLPLLLSESYWKNDVENDGTIKNPIKSQNYEIDIINAKLIEQYGWQKQSKLTSEEGLVTILKTHANLKIEYSEKTDILKIKKDIMKLRNLLTILCGEALTISYISFKSKTVDLNGNPMPGEGRFYYSQIMVEKKMNQITSSYRFNDIRENFAEVLSNYFEYYNKLQPVVHNLYINIALKSLVEVQFHDAITSLEVYHREFYSEEKNISETMQNTINQFIKIVDLNHENQGEKKELNRMIDGIGKTTLKNRVKRLIKDLPTELKGKIVFDDLDFTSNSRINDFAYKCANTRNHHAHGSTNSNSNIFESNDLIAVTKILNLVSEYYLMKQIGLEEKIIIRGIQNKKNYQNVLKDLYSFEQPK